MSTPADFYKNAINLNRYSNSVAKRIIGNYNDLMIDSIEQLQLLDGLPPTQKATRLRSILGQLKVSINQWSANSTSLSIAELEELAGVEAGFVEDQLRKALPAEMRNQVNEIAISPNFAESLVTVDPTQRGIVSLSDDLEAAVTGAPKIVQVTMADGVTLTLPNGQVLKKAFEDLGERQTALFGQAVRNGLQQGETTESIVKRLKGRLQKGQSGSINQILAAGGQATIPADNQIRTLIRTSINQVANAASEKVFAANPEITKKYKYSATLDGRTSPICRALDGTIHDYGKGPVPPQHFNCRSQIVPIVDYERLGIEPPPEDERASASGLVPEGVSYGKWLKDLPEAERQKILGSRTKYFDFLEKKIGPEKAIRRFVREDGSEKTIEELKKDVSKFKGKPAKAKTKVTAKKQTVSAKTQPLKEKPAMSKAKTLKVKAEAVAPKPKATITKQKTELQAAIAKAEKKVATSSLAEQIAAKEKEFKSLNFDVLTASGKKEVLAAADKAKKAKAELEALKLKDPAYAAAQKKKAAALKKEFGEAEVPEELMKAKPPQDALKRYTGEQYREMRAEEFRQAKKAGKKLLPFEEAQINIYKADKDYAKDAVDIESFLKRAPKYKGEVYRTMIVDQAGLEDMLANYRDGKGSLAMESWTSNEDLNFAKGGLDQRVLLRAKNKQGVDISSLSAFENEDEVLMPKGVRYRLKDVTKEEISKKATKEGRFSWIVDLEQL